MKNIITLLVTLAISASLASKVYAAPGSGKSVSLVSVEYQSGGIVLIFATSGLSKSDLKDNLFVADSDSQAMGCNFVDETPIVRCVVSKSLAGRGGFYATLAGFAFWGELPQARDLGLCGPGEIVWYSYDIFHNNVLDWSDIVPAWVWELSAQGGFFETMAEDGYTYEITGSFCSSEPWIPEV